MSSSNTISPSMAPEKCDRCDTLAVASVLCPICETKYCSNKCREEDKGDHDEFCGPFAAFLKSYPKPPVDGNFVFALILDEDLQLAWLEVVPASIKKDGAGVQKEQTQLIACAGPLGLHEMPTTEGLSVQVKNLIPSAANHQVRLFYLKGQGLRQCGVKPNKYVDNLLAGRRNNELRGAVVVAKAVIVDTELNALYGNITPKDAHTARQYLTNHYDDLVGGLKIDVSKRRQAPHKKDRLQAAARQRRQQQELKNAQQSPPAEENICAFCEYERIFGTPPKALIEQYEIKDRKVRKQGGRKTNK